MTCESLRRNLSLYLYGELSFDEEELLEQHLDGCEDCRRELEREKKLHEAFDRAELAPPPEMLERCRLELSRQLRRTSRPASNPAGWLRGLRSVFFPSVGPAGTWLRPLAAAALVALGFFGARLTTITPSGFSPIPDPADPVASRVRYVEPFPSGDVRIVVEETRQHVLSGRLEDESIRRLLLAAAQDPADPGLRAESVDLLKSRSESEEVRSTLLYALQNDPNDGVRLKALEGLKSHVADAVTRRALSKVLLTDSNPGIRTMAVDLLVQTNQQDVVGTLQELLRKEDNSYVRLRCQKALLDMNASVETF